MNSIIDVHADQRSGRCQRIELVDSVAMSRVRPEAAGGSRFPFHRPPFGGALAAEALTEGESSAGTQVMSDFMEQREDKQVSFGQRVKGEPAVKADNAYFAVNNCLSVYRRAFNVDLNSISGKAALKSRSTS